MRTGGDEGRKDDRQSKNKASNDGFQSFSELEDVKSNGTATEYKKKKSPLELARERHAKNKAAKESGKDKDQAEARILRLETGSP